MYVGVSHPELFLRDVQLVTQSLTATVAVISSNFVWEDILRGTGAKEVQDLGRKHKVRNPLSLILKIKSAPCSVLSYSSTLFVAKVFSCLLQTCCVVPCLLAILFAPFLLYDCFCFSGYML